MAEYAETYPLNRIEPGDRSLGIITCGMAYQHVRELFPTYSVLKLGMVYPLPRQMIQDFAAQVERLVIIEELDPFIEEQVRAWGIPVAAGKDYFPLVGELTLARVREAALRAGLPVDPLPERVEPLTAPLVPPRPPAM